MPHSHVHFRNDSVSMYGLVSLMVTWLVVRSSVPSNGSQVLNLPPRNTGGDISTGTTSAHVIPTWWRPRALFACRPRTSRPIIQWKVDRSRWSNSLAKTVARFNSSRLFPVGSREELCLRDTCRIWGRSSCTNSGGSRNYWAHTRSCGACEWKHASQVHWVQRITGSPRGTTFVVQSPEICNTNSETQDTQYQPIMFRSSNLFYIEMLRFRKWVHN